MSLRNRMKQNGQGSLGVSFVYLLSYSRYLTTIWLQQQIFSQLAHPLGEYQRSDNTLQCYQIIIQSQISLLLNSKFKYIVEGVITLKHWTYSQQLWQREHVLLFQTKCSNQSKVHSFEISICSWLITMKVRVFQQSPFPSTLCHFPLLTIHWHGMRGQNSLHTKSLGISYLFVKVTVAFNQKKNPSSINK